MAQIESVAVADIDSNPLRRLPDYPFNETKLAILQRSIEDVGLWEGVIGRRVGNRVQLAFGHHRIEAARRVGLTSIPIIIRDLTDEDMLKFLGRENLEDFNADFLVMLETWEAAEEFVRRHGAGEPRLLDVATLLGWTRLRNDNALPRSNETAQATSDAVRLIRGGYLKRTDLAGIAVKSAREICARVVAHHEMLDKMAKKTGRPAKEIEKAKKVSGKAGGHVAKKVREGKVAVANIRGEVDAEAYEHAQEAKKKSPLFSMFGKSVAESISRIAKEDALADRLTEVRQALDHIELDEDVEIVKRLALECEHASTRLGKWATVFDNPHTKVVPLKAIGKE